MNASTSYERTSYYARALGRDANFALGLIADVILAPRWTDDELEKEKGVVAQERGEALDQPDDRVFELHQGVVFSDQALGRPVLGEEETLAGVDVAVLERFKEKHYAPSRIVVAVAGAFDRAAILELCERRFGAMPARADIAPAPAAARAGSKVEERKLAQTHIALSWPGPRAGAENLYAARLLAEVYGGGMASRLFQDVRERSGLVYQIDAYLDPYEDIGRLGVYAACAAKNAAEVMQRSADILHALADRGPSEAEVARAKAVVTAQILMGAETPMARAETRASQAFLLDRLPDLAEMRRRVEAVTLEGVRAAAREAVCGPAAASAIGPKAGLAAAPRFPTLFT